ncbi:hypothetical protein KLP28_14320 [Nocardioidaceae bacterium]|nr:hypothetical protein KLP28_14320 [Nocardioidaceae bacterium]
MSSSAEPRGGSAGEPRPAPVPDLRLVRLPAQRTGAEPLSLLRPEDRARTRAEADGYAAGYFRGIADSRRRAAAELATGRARLEQSAATTAEHQAAEHAAAVRALTDAAAALTDQLTALREELTADAADLAAVLVEAILGRELGRLDTRNAADDVVRRVLGALGELAAESGQGDQGDQLRATVRLSPAVVAVLDDTAREGLARHGARVVADPGLERDDAVVDAASTRVDLRLASTVRRVRAALCDDQGDDLGADLGEDLDADLAEDPS